jgi:hypothetical protein
MKLLLLSIFTLLMAENYKIATVQELAKVLLEDGKNIYHPDEQLQTNYAFVFFLKSGKVVLLPNDRLDKSQGLLFDTRQAYQNCLQNDSFPIPEKQTVVEDRYKEQILNVETNINTYLQEAANLVSYDLAKGNLKDLLLELRKHNQKKYKEKDYFYSVLALGEYIRTVKNGKWTILKRYRTFNPYYTPAVMFRSGREIILRDKMELFFDSQIPLENYIRYFMRD